MLLQGAVLLHYLRIKEDKSSLCSPDVLLVLPVVRCSDNWLRYVGQSFGCVVSELIG